MTQAGPAIPVIAVTDRAPDAGPALRVVVVSDGRATEAGPARPVIVVSDGRPTQANEPLPVVVATGAQASQVLAGPAIAVYVVSGTLGGTAPANTVLPVVSGATELGATLTTTDGTWTGTAPIVYTYQWKRNGVAIGGATNNTYVLQAADLGTTITATVTATNAIGSASATSAGTSIPAYLLLDRFTTDDAAPLTSPRTCEPGPGTLTITDTGNRLSISSSALQIGSVAALYSLSAGANVARVAGRMWAGTFTAGTGTGTTRAGWNGAASSRGVAYYLPAGLDTTNSGWVANGAVINNIGFNPALFTRLGTIQRSVGGFYVGRTGGNWVLLWVDNASNQNTNLIIESFNTNAYTQTIDDLIITDLPDSAWTTAYGLATDRVASPGANATAIMTADGIVEVTITAAAGVTQNLHVRRTDASNSWIIRMNQGASTIAIIENNAGVETSRNSVAQTWTDTTQYRVVVTCTGNSIRTFVANVAKNAYTSASFNNTATGVLIDTAASDLVCWPRSVTLPNV